MARERTPEGKRVVIPVRVSEPKAEAIDKARGGTPRSVWIERAVDAALALLAAGKSKPQAKGDRANTPKAAREPESASDIVAALRRRNGGQG